MSALPRGKPFEKGTDPRRTPGGRTKEQAQFSKSLKHYIVHHGEQAMTYVDRDTGKVKRLKRIEAVVRAIYNEAMQGNMQAANLIFEKVEGKITQNNTNLNVDFTKLSVDQLERIAKGEDVSVVIATG